MLYSLENVQGFLNPTLFVTDPAPVESELRQRSVTEKELVQATTQDGINNVHVCKIMPFYMSIRTYADPAPVKSEQQQRKVTEEVPTSPGGSSIGSLSTSYKLALFCACTCVVLFLIWKYK